MQWSQDQAIAYESACECITAAIALHTAAIDDEERTTTPRPAVIDGHRSQILRLFRERKALRPDDDAAVNRARIEYGSLVRAELRQVGQNADHLLSA